MGFSSHCSTVVQALHQIIYLGIVLVLTSCSWSSADAISFLHKGKDSMRHDVVLRGKTISDLDESLNIGLGLKKNPAVKHMVEFYIHLERDVVVWDELSTTGASLKCSKNSIIVIPRPSRVPVPQLPPPCIGDCNVLNPRLNPRNVAHMENLNTGLRQTLGKGVYELEISGVGIDLSDFPVRSVFVISEENWEASCRQVIESVSGVDEEDDTLFLEIISTRKANPGRGVTIQVRRISGDGVAPIVDVEVHEKTVSSSALPRKFVFDEGSLQVASREIHAAEHFISTTSVNDTTLITTSRATFSYDGRVSMSGLGHIDLNARVTAGIRRFRFTRLRGLQFKWEQHLYGSFSGKLLLNGDVNPNARTGPIFRYWIPKLSFSASIPFIARLRAGAFVGVNWIAEVDLKLKADITFNMRYQRREEVTAQVLPPRYSARNLLPASTGSSGSADVKLSGSYNGARFTGFVGVRPQVGVGIEYKRRKWFKWKTSRVEGNIGANLGLEAFAGVQIPGFKPFTSAGGKIGTCDRCHALQGRLSVKGKKLSAQLVVNNQVRSEAVFIRHLFEIRLGTICALPVPCDLASAPSPTPTRTPRPRPKSFRCGPCQSTSNCPTSYSCISGSCQRFNGFCNCNRHLLRSGVRQTDRISELDRILQPCLLAAV